ncbi:alpha/beta fold hydrolase [Actinoplanes sp. NPDC049599]|uniref:alpha/beta fold hydrolase n=1 Tax=Actinoplanes sp. NPDC049599 TaxID=3363903 RepID=UPI003792611B
MKLPYTAVEFTRTGEQADRSQVAAALAMIGTGTDVLLISHGWNNDIAGAERMYTRLVDNIATLTAARADGGRRLTVVGLLWPSRKWTTNDDDVAGHGLSAAGAPAADLKARVTETVEDPVAARRMRDLADRLDDSAEARDEFLALLRGQLPPQPAVADDDAPPLTLREGDTGAVFGAAEEAERDLAQQLGARPAPPPDDSNSPFAPLPDPLAGTGAAATGLFDFFRKSPLKAAEELLNITTFYSMKSRAGDVGARGVAALLDTIAGTHPDVRVHLAGHSFGARVVAMAAATSSAPISSLALLQGAFSHRGLAARDDRLKMPDGAFRRLLTGGHLRGPVVVTHTHNDKAVGLAYALASRLANQVASGLGDPGDPYGGLGANGAVGTAEAVAGELGDEHTTYAFRPGRVHNLHADKFVTNHSDVTNLAVANAVLAGMTVR